MIWLRCQNLVVGTVWECLGDEMKRTILLESFLKRLKRGFQGVPGFLPKQINGLGLRYVVTSH